MKELSEKQGVIHLFIPKKPLPRPAEGDAPEATPEDTADLGAVDLEVAGGVQRVLVFHQSQRTSAHEDWPSTGQPQPVVAVRDHQGVLPGGRKVFVGFGLSLIHI